MAVQTVTTQYHGNAYPGMVADSQKLNVVSKNNGTGATIAYGLGVISDGDDGAKLAGASFVESQFVGITRRELNRAYADGAAFGAPDKFDFAVVTLGVVWVNTVDAAAKDGAVYVDQDGTIRATDNGGAATLITDAKFVSTAGAGELVKVSLGLGG